MNTNTETRDTTTEQSVEYAVHLMENMLQTAAPYHKPFIERHIENIRTLAARASRLSSELDLR